MYHYKCNESIRMFRNIVSALRCIRWLQRQTRTVLKAISHAIFCVCLQNSDEWSLSACERTAKQQSHSRGTLCTIDTMALCGRV